MWNDALPRNGITNWKVYYAVQGTDTTTGWQTWMKPAGCAWVYILMIASGGGGGRPNNGSLSVAAGGGGTGGHTRLLIPAFVVPDILYVRAGAGGLGATSPGAGATGAASYVAMQPNTTVANSLIAQGAGGGAPGAANSGGGSGSGAGITTPAIQCMGLFTSQAGGNGNVGATALNANGGNLTVSASIITTGGTGGGNGTGNGGTVGNNIVFPNIAGGTGSTGGNGNNGFQLGAMWTPGLKSFPLIFSGGSGGGGSSAVGGTAGRGGNASYGGGGGGGGSCTDAGGTSGNGGNGGDGIIFIGAF